MKSTEFFTYDGLEIEKVKGIVFKVRDRLVGTHVLVDEEWEGVKNMPESKAVIEAHTDAVFIWKTYDIETGIVIDWTSYFPGSDKFIKSIEDIVKKFDGRIDDIDFKARCAQLIKTEYDKHPEIKKQVFGETE